MLIESKAGTTLVGLDDSDSGEGLSIFFSQDGESVCRYRVLVKARIDQGFYDMGEFFVSPPIIAPSPFPGSVPPGRLSRMVAAAVCPGTEGWAIEVSAVAENEGDEPLPIPEETVEIILASSKCCTAPVGVSRVSERYGYAAGTASGPTTNYPVLAGQTVTGIIAIGLTGGGSFTIDGGYQMLVNADVTVNFEPMALIHPNAIIEFNNVIFAVEYLESA